MQRVPIRTPDATSHRSPADLAPPPCTAGAWAASPHATGHMTLEGARGKATATLLGPSLFLFEMDGHLDIELARRYLGIVERFPSRRESFHDWRRMTGYDTRTRLLFTSWLIHNRHRMVCHHLSTSRLVSMGITVAQLAVGTSALRSYDNQDVFYDAVAAAVRRFGGGGGKLGRS